LLPPRNSVQSGLLGILRAPKLDLQELLAKLLNGNSFDFNFDPRTGNGIVI